MNKREGIVLNRMYVGDYLSTNLGHEVINMFQADNGGHYIYLNATGNFGKEHSGKIGYMLLVKYHSENIFEIIGMANGLTEVDGSNVAQHKDLKKINEDVYSVQKDYIEKENITYGGAPLLKIFNNAEQQNVYVTYKAERLYKPCRRLFIGYGKTEMKTDVVLEGYKQAKTTLKTYVYPEGTFSSDTKKENVEEKKNDYTKLLDLINRNDLWLEHKQRIDKKMLNDSTRDVSIFDICQIQNDENCFSYALKYFMEKYPKLWKMFFAMYGIDLDYNYKVTREESAKIEDDKWNHTEFPSGGRIDLLIRDNNNIIVIENKIKSDINTVATDNDKTQLDRYVNYVDWFVKNKCEKEPDCHFFILAPNYNIPQISDEMETKYKVITYRDLYNFLKITDAAKSDCNFKAFFDAMHRHTHDNVNDFLYYEMLEKFIRRINEVNQKNSSRIF